MLILPISSPNKCQLFAKIKIFLNFDRIKYTVRNKCIDHVILFGIKKGQTVSQAANPPDVIGVLFLFEVVFHLLPTCYQWRENLLAQDRISSYTYQTCSR